MKYSILIQYHDKEYIARCLEFPGASAFGDTYFDALNSLLDVLRSFEDVLKEDGDPKPKLKQLINIQSCSKCKQ